MTEQRCLLFDAVSNFCRHTCDSGGDENNEFVECPECGKIVDEIERSIEAAGMDLVRIYHA